jgi:diguanylate cyclase (GGDEF)-like protein
MSKDERNSLLLAEWQSRCRAHELLAHFPLPSSIKTVEAVGSKVLDGSGPPDPVLRGLASGLAATIWQAKGEVLQLQVGLLMEVMADEAGVDQVQLTRVHTLLSAAVASVTIEAWRDRAEQDELTSLRNRAGWESDASKFPPDRPLAYASIDIDGLKAVNDGPGGHQAGDELLRGFGKRLEIAVRSLGGSAYRYGGDEFSAVLEIIAGDLDIVLSELSQTQGVAPFSHGVAIWPEEDQDLMTILTLADRRMYERKKKRGAGLRGEH